MKKQLLILSIIACLFATPVLASINAVPNSMMIGTANYSQSNNENSISAQQAARIVKSRFGGKVLKVSKSGSKAKPSYRVKLLKDNGHVISVIVDAQSGRISG